MSKSGLYAHFRSKEELQLATVAVANEILTGVVVVPALDAPEGAQRLLAFCDTFLAHVEQRVFPGGCFFISAAAELSPDRGPFARRSPRAIANGSACSRSRRTRQRSSARSTPASTRNSWSSSSTGLLLAANVFFFLFEDAAELERARRGVRERLENLG